MTYRRRGLTFGLPAGFCAALFACLLPAGPCHATDIEKNMAGYLLRADDTILIRVPDSVEFGVEKTSYRVDKEGCVNLPLIGRRQAAGRTTRQLETELTEPLKSYYLEPRVTVSVVEFHTEPVSVLGSVNTPGLLRMNGEETLLEVLSRAGGLRPDAGQNLVISRRLEYGRLPLPEAADDPSGEVSLAELKLSAITTGSRASANIVLKPHDVVTVMRAQMVYVLGDVGHAGGYVLGDKSEMSALKALALAGGLLRTASPAKARILRHEQGASQRQEVQVNLSRIVKNKDADLELRPEDILFVPSDRTKLIATRTIESMVGIGSNILIWRGTQ
jgi:polysaccharide biosynthesis/export protein